MFLQYGHNMANPWGKSTGFIAIHDRIPDLQINGLTKKRTSSPEMPDTSLIVPGFFWDFPGFCSDFFPSSNELIRDTAVDLEVDEMTGEIKIDQVRRAGRSCVETATKKSERGR